MRMHAICGKSYNYIKYTLGYHSCSDHVFTSTVHAFVGIFCIYGATVITLH